MDAQTFQQEAMRYEKLLFHISYAILHSSDDCADAVQEALLRAWKSRDNLRDITAFRSWLCRILVNTCNDMLRKRAKEDYSPLPEDLPAPKPEHDPMELREALDALPPQQRAMVVMHYLEGWPVKDIAETFDLPQGTVKTRLMYARRKLGQWLSEEKEV